MFEELKTYISSLISTQEAGTLLWYAIQAKKYQHGDILTTSNNIPAYNTVDEEKQLIKYISVVEELQTIGGNDRLVLSFKVATQGVAGEITMLTNDELLGFKSYLNKIKFAGTFIQVQSSEATKIAYSVTVDVDKTVINDSGAMIDGSTTTPMIDALQVFHSNKNENNFNSYLYKNKAEDALQQLTGVVDAEITEARYFDGANWVVFDRKLLSQAGYEELSVDDTIITII